MEKIYKVQSADPGGWRSSSPGEGVGQGGIKHTSISLKCIRSQRNSHSEVAGSVITHTSIPLHQRVQQGSGSWLGMGSCYPTTSNAQDLDGRADIFDSSLVQSKRPESVLSCPPRTSSALGATSEITWIQHIERTHARKYTRHRSNVQDKGHTIADTEHILISAEYDADESFDGNREEMTHQAWKSLRARRELKEERRAGKPQTKGRRGGADGGRKRNRNRE
ncbi:hypothetical protein K505DRAFT_387978, partial [Melanomma pulvis-pyrius CBS 109.77]